MPADNPIHFKPIHDSNPIDLLEKIGLSAEIVRSMAFACGFCRRTGKIDPYVFLLHLCLESAKGTVSFNDLAARIEADSGLCASRQAYWERMDDSCLRFFQGVFARALAAKCPITQELLASGNMARPFRRILIQDSTLIRLPPNLFALFSGVSNGARAVCHARIQCIYDLVSGTFLKFTIDPYSRNDLLATLDLEAQPGDLVLRDRGYFTLQALQEHTRAGAHSIYRYKHYTALFDPLTGQPIELLALLKASQSLDREVLVGPQKIKVRLVAAPVDEETANLRRMRAKKEMKGHAPSQELLELMSWSIFLTTILDPVIGLRQILRLYAIRWRIENIFKTWKSNFSFAKVHRVSEIQLRVLLTARFMAITILYEKLFTPLALLIETTTHRVLSLMKFMRYISRNLGRIPELLDCNNPQCPGFSALLRYCLYDQRKRPNFVAETRAVLSQINGLTGLT